MWGWDGGVAGGLVDDRASSLVAQPDRNLNNILYAVTWAMYDCDTIAI